MVPQLWIWYYGPVLLTAYSMTREHHLSLKSLLPQGWTHPSSPMYVQIGMMLKRHIYEFGVDFEHNDGNVKFKSPLYMFEIAVISTLSDVQCYLDEPPGTRTIKEQKSKEHGFIHDILDIHSELDMIQSVLKQQGQVVKGLLKDTKATCLDANLTREAKFYSREIEHTLVLLEEYEVLIEKIHKDADRVEKTMESCLNLKRTYASIEDTRNSLMLGFAASAFAFVTVIFTPLSFMTSLFALPVDHFVHRQVNDASSAARVFTFLYIGGYTGTFIFTKLA
jgi:hypothetical protein